MTEQDAQFRTRPSDHHRAIEDNRPDDVEPEVAAHVQMAAIQSELAAARAALTDAKAREDALKHELQHRVSNMLSVIRSICRRTRESGASSDEFAEHFEGRLNAIARSQTYPAASGAPGLYLEDLLRDELLAIGWADGPPCTISGPPTRLGGKAAELIGLAIHELTTNSMKFGAVAQGGSLTINWSIEERSDGSVLRFTWTEKGVAAVVAAPRPSGFGRQLIELALPYQLGADTSFSFKPGGIQCVIRLPMSADCFAADNMEAETSLLPLLSTE